MRTGARRAQNRAGRGKVLVDDERPTSGLLRGRLGRGGQEAREALDGRFVPEAAWRR